MALSIKGLMSLCWVFLSWVSWRPMFLIIVTLQIMTLTVTTANTVVKLQYSELHLCLLSITFHTIMLNVVMLSVVLLNVVAPFVWPWLIQWQQKCFLYINIFWSRSDKIFFGAFCSPGRRPFTGRDLKVVRGKFSTLRLYKKMMLSRINWIYYWRSFVSY